MKHPPRDQDHENQGYDAYFQVNEDKSSRRALGGGDYSDQRDLEGNDFQMSEFSRSRMNWRSSLRSSLVAGSLI
jgi:hypothetical protein